MIETKDEQKRTENKKNGWVSMDKISFPAEVIRDFNFNNEDDYLYDFVVKQAKLEERELKQKQIDKAIIVNPPPDFGNIFDQQYNKTMGFKNEKYLYQKQSGKYLFW